MLEQLQAALVGALVLILPPLALLIVAKLRNMKADLDSAFAKIRAHEDEMGIKTVETNKKTKEQHVSRDPKGIGGSRSVPPRPLHQEGSGGDR